MEKKHISIIGSCLSRELFNTAILSDIFSIDCYAFQVCPWSLCNNGLDIPKESIYKANIEDFRARMFWYELDKVTLQEIEKYKSEYLMIDLHPMVGKIFKVFYNNKSIYAQSSSSRIKSFLENIENDNIDELKSLTIEEFDIESFDDNLIKNGLKLLADWAKKHFEETKIIINIPLVAKQYFNKNGNISSYSQESILIGEYQDYIVKKYSNILNSHIPNAIVLNDVGNKYAQFGIYDNFSCLTPPNVHFTDLDYLRQSQHLLTLLNINSNISFEQSLINSLQKKSNDFISLYFKYIDNNKHIITLNSYFDKIDNFNDFIFVFSAKDEASKNIKYFRNKNKLGISCSFNLRDSYIAIVDKSRNFIYEKVSQDKISYNYSVNNKTIFIQSAGFNAGNISSVKLNDNELNLSPNKRGLNIVVLNAKTLEIVDQAHCDTYIDKDLSLDSQYFKNIKLKI